MISANELKIGNWILDRDGQPYKIEYEVHASHVDDYLLGLYLDKISGIQLTEEWLLKFGFEKPDANDLFGGLLISVNHEYRLRLIKVSGIWTWEQNDKHLVLLRFVHQLQNLYFALTGQELELKK